MTVRTWGKKAAIAIMFLSLFWNIKYLPLNNSHLQLAVLAVLNWDTTRDMQLLF